MRRGNKLDVKITPQVPEHTPDGDNKPHIGIAWANDDDGMVFDAMGILTPSNPGPVEQIRHSMKMILNTFDAVISQKSHIGVQQMGGPVMMMHAYYAMLRHA